MHRSTLSLTALARTFKLLMLGKSSGESSLSVGVTPSALKSHQPKWLSVTSDMWHRVSLIEG